MKIDDVAVLPQGYGAWNVTKHPVGGNFFRASEDVIGTITRVYDNGDVELTLEDGTKLSAQPNFLK